MTGEKLLKFYDGISVSVHAVERMKCYLSLEERGMGFDEVISLFKTSKRIQRDEMYSSGFRPRDRKEEYTWFFKKEIFNTTIIFVVIEESNNNRQLIIKTTYTENKQNRILKSYNEQYGSMEHRLRKKKKYNNI